MNKSYPMLTLCMFTCIASVLPVSGSASTIQRSPYKLEKVIAVSRHTIRPPISISKLEKITDRKWSKWLVPDGHATGHGYVAAVELGRYLANEFQSYGLKMRNCPGTKSVYALADTYQRTRISAKALLDGMFPGCGIPVHSFSAGGQDPVFHGTHSPHAKLKTKIARKQVRDAIRASLEKARKRYLPRLKALKGVVCKDGQPCPFYEKKWTIKQNKNGGFKVTGIYGVGSISEAILLQYANNNPWVNIGFGHVRTPEAVEKFEFLNNLIFNLLLYKASKDRPYIAKRGGSEMMSLILSSLANGSKVRVKSATGIAPGNKLVLLVGHDTNIALLRTMLNLNWKFKHYPKNDPSLNGTLLFERFKNISNGKEYAMVKYIAQSLHQLRYLENLDAKNPPFGKSFAIGSKCKKTKEGYMCPLSNVISAMRSSTDRSAVVKYPFERATVYNQ